MNKVPVTRYSLPLLFKDEFIKDQDCRTPLCHLLDLRRDGHLQATVYRGLLKRCEELRKRVGQQANLVVCQDNPENYVTEVVIVQRLQFAAMIFQTTTVICCITILALVRFPESRRKLASFLGCLFPSLIGALLTGLGLLIFSEHMLAGEELDYSYWMAALSSAMSAITTLLISGDLFTCFPNANSCRSNSRGSEYSAAAVRHGGEVAMREVLPPLNHGAPITTPHGTQHLQHQPTPARISPMRSLQQTHSTPQIARRSLQEDAPPKVDFSKAATAPPEPPRPPKQLFSYVSRPTPGQL